MLKAVLFDFNGVIIHDEPIHEQLINQLLVEENLRPKLGEFRKLCLGRSDRACLTDLMANRGRTVTAPYLNQLIARKAAAYQRELESLEKVPIYPGVPDLIFNLRAAQLKLAIVSGSLRSEIELVLGRAQLQEAFALIVSGDEPVASKPEPDIYLLAIDRLNQQFPGLNLTPQECLVIEDTFAGIEAAKRAGIPVVGVANTYPFHMLQRRANWTVDYLFDLELDRIRQTYDRTAA
ncbi:MAG TPA: HAD family phosphatase [Microcoleaceae cyanobacterium]|jgi:HAD superfamily hydrolase (TIGR01509 family)